MKLRFFFSKCDLKLEQILFGFLFVSSLVFFCFLYYFFASSLGVIGALRLALASSSYL